jgi:sarcosine oxidase subunit gamma
VVDVSSRAVGFALTGPGAVAALMRGCTLDLARFAPGRATRTVFETVEIQVWMIAPETFHVEVWRSFAPWLWHSLAEGIV